MKYCPLEEMWADVLTKPLQGAPFRKMRSKLMNMPEHYIDPDAGTTTPSKTGANTLDDGSTGVGRRQFTGVRPRNVSFSKPVVTNTHRIPRTRKSNVVKLGLPTRHPNSANGTSRRRKSETSTSARRSVLGNIKDIPVRPSYKQILAGSKTNATNDKIDGRGLSNDGLGGRKTLGPDWPALNDKSSSMARGK